MYKFLIISDLHLNYIEPVHKDIDLFNYFTSFLNKKYKILLLGDIYDIIRNESFKYKREYFAIRGYYPKTTTLIEENKNIIYIEGNHDAVLKQKKYIEKIISNFELKYHNRILYFAHGHVFDDTNGRFHFIGDTISRIFGFFVENVKNKDIVDNIQSLEKIDNTHKKLKKGAKQLLNVYDFVIMGHTHKQFIKIKKDKVYINTGSSNNEIIDENILKISSKNIKFKLNKVNISSNKLIDQEVYFFNY